MSVLKKEHFLTWVFVEDWDASKQFYAEVLGLELGLCADEGGWAEFKAGPEGAVIAIHKTAEGQDVAQGGGVPAWYVDDLDGTMEALKEKGVEFHDVHEVPGMVRIGSFRDPSGNCLQIIQVTQ